MSISGERRARIDHLTREVARGLATKTVLFHSALAGRLGLNATALKCLDVLRSSDPPMTASELAERTGLTGGAITTIADRLEAEGFIERVRDPHDRRRWELRAIASSRKQVLDLFAPLRDAMATICEDLTDHELDVVTEFLTKLGTAMDFAADDLRRSRPSPFI
jgi:DNA-binding MarR family transcriptional regulator